MNWCNIMSGSCRRNVRLCDIDFRIIDNRRPTGHRELMHFAFKAWMAFEMSWNISDNAMPRLCFFQRRVRFKHTIYTKIHVQIYTKRSGLARNLSVINSLRVYILHRERRDREGKREREKAPIFLNWKILHLLDTGIPPAADFSRILIEREFNLKYTIAKIYSVTNWKLNIVR